ncbi:hypothetical protein Tco_0011799 [Tanacetum coccineum]
MGGSYYLIPCSFLSTGKDRKTPQRYPDVPTTSWRISIRSMDSFQGLTLKNPSSWHRSLASSPNLLRSCQLHHRESIDYAAGGRLRKLRPYEAWDTIKKLAQYKNEGWNDAFNSEEVSFNYENPDVKQLLGIMEHKVDTLMKNAISLMGKSESVFQYDPLHKGIKFRLGGMEREMHLFEFGWRVGLYSERESQEVATLSGLRNADFKDQACSSLPHNDHHGKEGNHLTKTSLIKMGVIMELHEGECCWPATIEVTGEGGGDDEEGDREGGNKVIGGSTDIYRNMSQGEWQVHQAQWMGQQDERWGRLNTWMGKQDQRANWMYEHTVPQFQYLLTRDNLEPHL